jgi:DNA-binding CsgD family transcriptional regulator
MSRPDHREPTDSVAEGLDHLERGRNHYEQRAWRDAYDALTLADRAAPLGTDDLELLAMSAYLIGREEGYLRALERAHRGFLDAEQCLRAARCAFWIGLCLLFRGETGPATGWFGRAQRLLEREGRECIEQGYMLVPLAEQCLSGSDSLRAYASATRAAEIGERFAELDLIACARHLQGRALLQQGQVEQGLALLDEAMVAVVAGELSPLMTGLVYCSVIDSCMQVYALARAREWTFALSSWCERQPQLVSFTGTCLVHRAEIMQLYGAWPDAIEEARRACAGFPGTSVQPAAAFYQQGEVYRLRGDVNSAEEAYREASRRGFEPQPGLALLRMAQGRVDAAAVAIRRTLSAATDRLERTRLIPAGIEIMLAAGDIEEARSACRELEEVARSFDAGVLGAMAAHARGSIELAGGDAAAALSSLRHAFEIWRQVEAPYPAARVRELLGLACRALGDDEGAGLELEAARAAFQQLGAAPDLARIDLLAKGASPTQLHGLTQRELQVLRLVATGKTNKAIASELFLSERTVDRHVSNLFGKLDVPSRAAATTYAHKHKLI